MRNEILGRGLSALLFSNPSNPTGKLVSGKQLEQWVRMSSELDCALIIDEFYSSYIWKADGPASVSAVPYIDNTEKEPIIILDGLTKNWRLPGFRIGWSLAPRHITESITAAGSFLDGGASRIMQNYACELLADKKQQAHFKEQNRLFKNKRTKMLGGLASVGLKVDIEPEGGFYLWVNLKKSGIKCSGMQFFKKALKHKLIVTPGEFFDIDPGSRRAHRKSRFDGHVRICFGPEEKVLSAGLSRLKLLVESIMLDQS